jgi:hypothetical protein
LVPTHSLHGATSSLQLRSHRAGFSDAKPLNHDADLVLYTTGKRSMIDE